MDPAALAARLEAIEQRFAGSDAERRAAQLCADELRRGGREPRTETLWFRPQVHGPRAVFAAVGVAASVVAVSHHVVGLALAGGALLATLLDAARVRLLAPLLARRATQNVIAPPSRHRDGDVLLILSASADAPGRSIISRLERLRRGSLLPGAAGLLLVALALVAACAGARVAGAGGTALGVVQLVPTAALILLVGAFAEAALARPAPRAPAGGPAVALAVALALDAQPPRHLAVEVLVAGAGEAGAAGMAAYVRARRRGVRPEDVVVVHLGSSPGTVRYLARDGESFGARLHPRLVQLAGAVPGTERLQGRGRSGARVARGARWPAIGLEGDARPLAAATLRLVAAIDADLRTARQATSGDAG
ncbi:MAG: hypothetical protein QOF12_1258 [Solirubrobacteraceae bacterium]|nr:hypothetical protein [Solirubrobacteraceae bacterium]